MPAAPKAKEPQAAVQTVIVWDATCNKVVASYQIRNDSLTNPIELARVAFMDQDASDDGLVMVISPTGEVRVFERPLQRGATRLRDITP